jgi:hypothetical protein
VKALIFIFALCFFEGISLRADNKPDLSVTPHWTASLHAVWNLDTVKLEHVDFRPGPIELRPNY